MIARIPTRGLLRLLVLGVVALTLASLAGQVAKYQFGHDSICGLGRLFNVDLEGNVPSWFQATFLLGSAVLLGALALSTRARRQSEWRGWLALALTFAVLSLDEASSFHERLVLPERLLGAIPGFRIWSWIVFGVLALAVLWLWLRPFYRALPARTRRRVAFAATVYLTGAVVLEGFGGFYALGRGIESLTYNLIVTAEELLEMLGQVAFIAAWLEHLHGLGAIAFVADPPSRQRAPVLSGAEVREIVPGEALAGSAGGGAGD